MKAVRLVCLLVACVVAVVNPSKLRAQAVSATLLGTVTDSSGGVVGEAKVTITEQKTNVSRTGSTNRSGNYEFSDIPPGLYQVVVEHPGFKIAERKNIDVTVNSTVRVDLKLEPGAASETITVIAETPILQTDRADVGAKMEATHLMELPFGANHNFQNLMNLVPGTTRMHREHSEFFNPQDSLSTEVNGQSRLFNDLKIEGVDNNHRTGLLQVYIPPAEAIQTVDVVTSNYSAEFGRAGGAVTNVQLKSGTNEFHGAVFEANRVSALSALPFFQDASVTPKGHSTYNYYGGMVGGPIIKNRLFFFADLVRIDDSRGKFDQLTVPTDAFRGGDLTAAGVNIYDPQTGSPNGTGRTQFVASANPFDPRYNPACTSGTCANIIPLSRISPLAQKILAFVPPANKLGLTRNYQATTRFLKHTTPLDMKFDFTRTRDDRFAYRFSRSKESIYEQPIFGLAGGPKGGGFLGTGTQYTQSTALTHTHVFSSTLISEARIGVSHYHNISRNADYGSKATDALGIRGANLDDFTSGLTAIVIQGGFSEPMVGYSASMPWDRSETNINAVSNWTKIHGNHSFKWGVDIRRLRDDLVQAQTFGPRGVFRFGTGTTALNTAPGSSDTGQGNNFAAFLIDAPTEVGRDVSVISGSWRETEFFTYVQDKWQLTPKLTTDIGLRWELYFPPTPAHPGGYSNYDPTTNSLVLAGIGSNPSDMGRVTSYRNFAPRLGMAYRLTQQTVIRAGFGISYEPFGNNQYAFNFPVRQANGSNQTSNFALPTWVLNGPVANMAFGFPAPSTQPIPANGIIQLPDPKADPQNPLSGKSGEALNVIDRNFRNPYVEAWNLAIQRSLYKNFVLEVAYVGNRGLRIPMTYNLNAEVAPGVDATGKTIDVCTVRPLCVLYNRTANTDFLFKPTTSNYNSLQVKLDHRWSDGLLLTTAWTYGKAMAYRSDQGSDGGSPHFYLDTVNGVTVPSFRRNYSVTSQDRRHILVQSFVYELPFGKGKSRLQSGWGSRLAGGWQVSGILTFMTGRPLRFTANGNSLNAARTTQTPIQIAPFQVFGAIGPKPKAPAPDTTAWFDTTAFCPVGVPLTQLPPGCPAVANGVMGNMQHYLFAGPHFFDFDASVSRNFRLTERFALQMRADAFSVTNTPRFDLPNVNRNETDFGHITNTIGGDRQVSFGARLTF